MYLHECDSVLKKNRGIALRQSPVLCEEMAEYLNLVEQIPDLNMEVFPVPRNSLYTEEGQEVTYANDLLLQMIQSYAGFTVGGE